MPRIRFPLPSALVAACLASTLGAPAAVPADELDPLKATAEQSAVYTMGLLQARELHSMNFTDDEFALYAEGLRDGYSKQPKLPLNRWLGPALRAEHGRKRARIVEEQRASEAFLAYAAAEPGARTLDSGLVFTELEPGRGAHPSPDSIVSVHYHGTVRDGTVVERSDEKGDPVRFALREASACWQQGLQLMRAGGRAKLVCPAVLAYGDRPPSPVVTPGAVLTYEIELNAVQ
jgi:FKBP-type peptidyl-prolyl cis-trans isomerase